MKAPMMCDTNTYEGTKKQTRRRHHAQHDTCKIHKTNLTSKIIGGWIQWTNMQLIFKFQVNRMKSDNFRNSALLTLWPMWTSKIIGGWIQWLKYKSSSNFKSIGGKLGFKKYHLGFWPWAYVDLFDHVDLKNNWLVEFSDLKYKSSSNFKSIGWKLRILEISP